MRAAGLENRPSALFSFTREDAMGRTRSIGCSDAARILGISAQLLRWRSSVGKIPVVSKRPLRFSPSVLVENRERMQRKDTRGRKALTALEAILT